nr:Chain B, peptide n-Y-c [synthetic construct]
RKSLTIYAQVQK